MIATSTKHQQQQATTTMKYLVTSINTSDAKSDTKIAAWLNEHAEKGYRLVKTTDISDNGVDHVLLIMELQRLDLTPTATPEKTS